MVVDFPALARQFVEAQLAADRAAALRIVEDGIAHGASVIEVQAHVIGAAQAEIGRRWEANEISVAQEHLATGVSQLVMARMYDRVAATPRNGIPVAVACVEGEHHDFPARLVADYLEHAGFTVRYFGANLPTEALVSMLAADRPRALALSATMTFNVPALRSAVARIRSELGALPIVIGGYAVEATPALAGELGVESAPSGPEETIAALRRAAGLEAAA